MLKVGTLVAHVEDVTRFGVITATYAPNVYENRLYSVRWQNHGALTLEEERSLVIAEAVSDKQNSP